MSYLFGPSPLEEAVDEEEQRPTWEYPDIEPGSDQIYQPLDSSVPWCILQVALRRADFDRVRILTGRTEEKDNGKLCFEIAKEISDPGFREEHGINDRIALGLLFHCNYYLLSFDLYKERQMINDIDRGFDILKINRELVEQFNQEL